MFREAQRSKVNHTFMHYIQQTQYHQMANINFHSISHRVHTGKTLHNHSLLHWLDLFILLHIQCFDDVGWATGRESGL